MNTFSLKLSRQQGFTLIELLVVIAIIGLLASVVLASLGTARAKARDARKIADFKNITTALYLYYDQVGRMPNNYSGFGACEGSTYYNQSMQELVDAGLLSTIPKSPGGDVYCYFNYGGTSSATVGALVKTVLEAASNTTTGIPPSCRPFTDTNWCSTARSDKEYCICNTY